MRPACQPGQDPPLDPAQDAWRRAAGLPGGAGAAQHDAVLGQRHALSSGEAHDLQLVFD